MSIRCRERQGRSASVAFRQLQRRPARTGDLRHQSGLVCAAPLADATLSQAKAGSPRARRRIPAKSAVGASRMAGGTAALHPEIGLRPWTRADQSERAPCTSFGGKPGSGARFRSGAPDDRRRRDVFGVSATPSYSRRRCSLSDATATLYDIESLAPKPLPAAASLIQAGLGAIAVAGLRRAA